MSLWRPGQGQLTAAEIAAIQAASLQPSDTVAKLSDIPASQLTSDELTAIQNASLGSGDTVAKVSDIPASQLTSDELTAIQNSSLGSGDTVAKISDISTVSTTRIIIPCGEIELIQGLRRGYNFPDGNWRGSMNHYSNANPAEWQVRNYLYAGFGAYTIYFQWGRGTDRGIVQTRIKKLGDADFQTLGSTDMYGSGLVSSTSYSFTPPSTGWYIVNFFVNSKNASSSDYYCLQGQIEMY